jgi:hypothetical protein
MPAPSAERLPTWWKSTGVTRGSPRATMRSYASVSIRSRTMMISSGPCSRHVSRQRIRMSGSSWYDGTTSEVVERKSLSIGLARAERITR